MANTKLPSRLLDTSAIPALNVTGDLTVDTTTLKVDSTNNRVGIGVASPKTTLNLAANNSGQGAILTLENTDTSITTGDVIGQIDFYANDGSSNGTGPKVNIKAVAQSGAGTVTELTFGTSPSSSSTAIERMRIDASGNVGIGTDNPGARLELDNPSSFTNMIEYGNVTWNQNSGHGLVAVNRGSDGYVQLQLTSGVDNADVFTIRNSGTGANVQHNLLSNGNVYHAGDVGIGTNNPGAKLEISGKDDSGASDLLRLQFDNSPADTGITFTDINSDIKNRISMDSANTNDLQISAGTQMSFHTGTTGSGNVRMKVNSTGILLPAGDFAYHTTQEHYTNPSSPGSFSTATNTAYTSSTQYWPVEGEKMVCVINARAFTRYLHIKTNLTSNNVMFYFRTKGYFYGHGMEEQLVGGYTYYSGGNQILSKDNKRVAGDSHTADTYRATDGSLVLKVQVEQLGYTEGKMLVFFGSHAPSTVSAITVTAVTQKDDGTNAF